MNMIKKIITFFITLILCFSLSTVYAAKKCTIKEIVTNISDKNIQLMLGDGNELLVNQRINASKQIAITYDRTFRGDEDRNEENIPCPSIIFSVLYSDKEGHVCLDRPVESQWHALAILSGDFSWLNGLENKSYILS